MSRQDLRINVLDYFCGCGSPEVACRTIMRLLELHPLHEPGHKAELRCLVSDTGVEYLLLYQLDHMELTEHGGSIHGAWLSPKGEAVLQGLRREAEDDFDALCESYCIHGYSVDMTSSELDDHDCLNAPEPVKWNREGPKDE